MFLLGFLEYRNAMFRSVNLSCFTTASDEDPKPKLIVRVGFCTAKSRVGSHVVSVRIHCTEKWRTSFHDDVLSKSK